MQSVGTEPTFIDADGDELRVTNEGPAPLALAYARSATMFASLAVGESMSLRQSAWAWALGAHTFFRAAARGPGVAIGLSNDPDDEGKAIDAHTGLPLVVGSGEDEELRAVLGEDAENLAPFAFRARGWKPMALHAPTPAPYTLLDSWAATDSVTWAANPSIVKWRGEFWMACDANRTGGTTEAAAGQKILLKRSPTGLAGSWATSVNPFTDAAYANNPIVDTAVHIQPNLLAPQGDDGPLLCFWNRAPNAQISRLTAPNGKWSNYRMEFDTTTGALSVSTAAEGSASAGHAITTTIRGVPNLHLFFCCNPIMLHDGTIAIPITMIPAGNTEIDPAAPSTAPVFFKSYKTNHVLYTNVSLLSWAMSDPIPEAASSFPAANWEPFLVEADDETLYVHSRNNRTAVENKSAQLVARSHNRMAFSVAKDTELEVPVSRGYALQTSPTRWLQAHCDHPNDDTTVVTDFLSKRFNGTLLVSRRGIDDFVPGIPFSGLTNLVNYPQFCADDGMAVVVWGEDRDGRRHLMVSRVAIPDDAAAYVHPRRLSRIKSAAGPLPVAGSPSYLRFTGVSRATSAALLDGTGDTGDTAVAGWFSRDEAGSTYALVDARNGSAVAGGPVVTQNGASLNSISFPHDQPVPVGAPFFVGASCVEATGVVTVFFSDGTGALTEVVNYLKVLTMGSLPANNETVVIDGTTFTFKTTPSAGTDVQIGSTVAATVTSLITSAVANGKQASIVSGQPTKLMVARTDGATFSVTPSAAVTVDSTASVFRSGDTVRFGFKRPAASGLLGLKGRLYRARVHKGAYTTANMRWLHNDRATALGLTAVTGTATDPGAPTILLTETSDATGFSDFADPVSDAATATVEGRTVLALTGEGSAAVETPWEATAYTIRFRLGALPAGSDKYVIATVGTATNPVRIHMSGSDPTGLYLENNKAMTIADPTKWTTVEVIVSPRRVSVGTLARESLAPGGTRMYLGSAFPQGLLAGSKTTQLDVSRMRVAEVKVRVSPLDPDILESITGNWTFTGNPTFANLNAAAAAKGLTRLSLAPEVPATPVAVGDNDPRVDKDTVLPWRHDVNVFMKAPLEVGTWGVSLAATDVHGAIRTSASNQNDAIGWDLIWAAGTWRIVLMHRTAPSRPIYSVQLGGIEQGTIDGYSAGTVYNVSSYIDVVLPTTAKRRLSLVAATRNASNTTGWLMSINGLCAYRIA